MSSSERIAYSEVDARPLTRFWPLALLPAAGLGWFLGIAVHDMGPLAIAGGDAGGGRVEAGETGRTLWQFQAGDTKSWRLGSNGARVESLGGGRLRLHGDRTATGNQLESPRITVRHGERLHITWNVRAVSGQMAVGILDAAKGVWINAVSVGDKDIDLKFASPTTAIRLIIVNNHSGDAPSVADIGPARLATE